MQDIFYVIYSFKIGGIKEDYMEPLEDEKIDDPIADCCADTIDKEISLNSMVMCPNCKRIIKGFLSKNAFSHYVTFCESRKRQITRHKYASRYIVTFNPVI